jgi:hypothetical protein
VAERPPDSPARASETVKHHPLWLVVGIVLFVVATVASIALGSVAGIVAPFILGAAGFLVPAWR